MAKRIPNWQRKKTAAEGKARLSTTVENEDAGLKKRIKPKSSSERVNPRLTDAQKETFNGLVSALDKKYTDETREEMNKDVQVISIRASDFEELIELHFKEIESAIKKNKRISNEDKKQYLAFIKNNKNVRELSEEFATKLAKLLRERLKKAKASGTINLKEPKNIKILGEKAYIFLIHKISDSADSAFVFINKRLMPGLKKDILDNSRKSVKSSIFSITICGFDLDTAPTIGRSGIGGAAKNILLSNAPINPDTNKKQPGAGVQLGHLRGGLIINTERAVAVFRAFSQQYVKFQSVDALLSRKFKIVEEHDAEVEVNIAILDVAKGAFSGKANFSILRFEGAAPNSLSGFIAQQASNNLRKWMADKAVYLLTSRKSPSIANLIFDDVINVLLGVKTGKRVPRRKVSKRGRVTGSANNSGIDVGGIVDAVSKANLDKALNESEDQSADISNLNSLINLLNSKMHDKVRENMGKGGSKQVLNYRTGRFAKSAKIQSLYNINEKRAIGAQVKYMKYPYGTFEPGGRLHKPGRDPHRIFGRSIRQILQEEKIANLRRVKVKLDG